MNKIIITGGTGLIGSHLISFLKENKVKDINDSLFRFVRDLLVKNRMYNGYNFYKDEEIKLENGDVATKMILAGSCTDYDYLQLW